MVDSTQKARLVAAPSGGREKYEAPELRVFGAVGALTQSGSKRAGEISNKGRCRGGSMSDPMC